MPYEQLPDRIKTDFVGNLHRNNLFKVINVDAIEVLGRF